MDGPTVKPVLHCWEAHPGGAATCVLQRGHPGRHQQMTDPRQRLDELDRSYISETTSSLLFKLREAVSIAHVQLERAERAELFIKYRVGVDAEYVRRWANVSLNQQAQP